MECCRFQDVGDGLFQPQRLHGKSLPGKPDLVFAGRRKVIFVHGCFWHGHDCARGDRRPKASAECWSAKITRNREHDRNHLAALRADGWKAHVVGNGSSSVSPCYGA